MKFLLICSLALIASTAAEELFQRDVLVPTMETEGRITNGQKATEGEFPYQVGLLLQLSASSSAWCGGSLIGKTWVLTAAHCTDSVESVTVYLGATKRTNAEVAHTVSSSDIIIHSNWDKDILKNDISLIKIPSISYSSRIQPVVLPSIASSYSDYDGDSVIASGWGRISDTTTSVTDDLMWAQMTVTSNLVCLYTYGTIVTSSNLCVSTPKGASPCNGDSGGPLVLQSNHVQVGLTSFGHKGGCEKGYPAAFTRITSYLDWIKDHTGIYY